MCLCYDYTERVSFISSQGHFTKCQLQLLIGSQYLSITDLCCPKNIFWTCKKAPNRNWTLAGSAVNFQSHAPSVKLIGGGANRGLVCVSLHLHHPYWFFCVSVFPDGVKHMLAYRQTTLWFLRKWSSTPHCGWMQGGGGLLKSYSAIYEELHISAFCVFACI